MGQGEDRQTPARIAQPVGAVEEKLVKDATSVELVQVVISRALDQRARAKDAEGRRAHGWAETSSVADAREAAARDLSLAITHLEDARTRLNAAGYRLSGRFSISDAERS